MAGKLVHPVFGLCRINEKGYPRVNNGPAKNKYLHRAVFEMIAGRPVRSGFHIHHMNGQTCVCGFNLLEIEAPLHPARVIRDPYTGEFMKPAQYERRYGRQTAHVEPAKADAKTN